MKAERSSDELKILELFKSNNIELGIQLCKIDNLNVVDLLARCFEDFNPRSLSLKIGILRVMEGYAAFENNDGSLFWCVRGVTEEERQENKIYWTMYQNFTNYKKLASIVYETYCKFEI